MHWTHRWATPSVRPRYSEGETHETTWYRARSHRRRGPSSAGLQPLARARADAVTDWNVIALNATAVPAQLGPAVARARDRPWRDLRRGPGGRAEQRPPMQWTSRRRPERRSTPRSPRPLTACWCVSPRAAADAGCGTGARPGEDRRRARPRPMAIDLGGQIAERIVALRGSDGAGAKVTFTPKPGVGLYQLTPPQSMAGDPAAVGRRDAVRAAQPKRPRVKGRPPSRARNSPATSTR